MKPRHRTQASEQLLRHPYTQSRIAKIIGVTPFTVCRWMHGVTRPCPYDQLALLAFAGIKPVLWRRPIGGAE